MGSASSKPSLNQRVQPRGRRVSRRTPKTFRRFLAFMIASEGRRGDDLVHLKSTPILRNCHTRAVDCARMLLFHHVNTCRFPLHRYRANSALCHNTLYLWMLNHRLTSDAVGSRSPCMRAAVVCKFSTICKHCGVEAEQPSVDALIGTVSNDQRSPPYARRQKQVNSDLDRAFRSSLDADPMAKRVTADAILPRDGELRR